MKKHNKEWWIRAAYILVCFALLVVGAVTNLPAKLSGGTSGTSHLDWWSNDLLIADLMYNQNYDNDEWELHYMYPPTVQELTGQDNVEWIQADMFRNNETFAREDFITYYSNIVAQRYVYAALDKLLPVTLGNAPRLGDKVTFWQFNDDGLPITTSGTLLATESSSPFTNSEPFVLYNVKSSVTPLKGGAGNPIMRDNKLVALSASCDPSAQKALAVTHTMISRFLQQARSGNYTGFPADGTQVTELTDPVFRKFLGLPETGGGFYVVKLPVYGSFYKAGVRPGDVVESVNGIPLDSKGLIRDPALGPVSANVLFRDSAMPGDIITLGIRRKGKDGVSQPMTLDVKLDRSALEGDLVNPSPFIANPPYRIYGGLVFVPLTGALVGEINKLSKNRPPLNLVEAIQKKEDIRKKGVDEIVVFLMALPTQATLGYAQMSPSIVEKVNGVQVKSFRHLNQLLDLPAPGGTHRIEVAQQPYTMYMSQKEAAKADRFIQMRAVPVLRRD